VVWDGEAAVYHSGFLSTVGRANQAPASLWHRRIISRCVHQPTASDGLVTIVLVSRNPGSFVDLVFPSIHAQTYVRHEIVVVDNGSSDGSVERIRAVAPAARILLLGHNTGFSHALNAGVRAAAGEYVLSLNFDVVLEPGFIGALVAALASRPEFGWAAGAMRRLTENGVGDDIDCNGHYLLRSRYCYGYDPDHPDPAWYSTPREVFGASACAALYRRSMLDALTFEGQIFDEDLFAYFEDVDLDWRAQQQGYRCVFVPTARGAHARGGRNLRGRPEVAALLMANRFLVMLKNDELRDLARDLWPIALRTGVDVLIQGRRHPRAIWLAGSRLARLAPKMLAKRSRIRRQRRAGDSPVSRFRLPTRFLG
jgi:GT2 family glycosyltransferase